MTDFTRLPVRSWSWSRTLARVGPPRPLGGLIGESKSTQGYSAGASSLTVSVCSG